jgi:hypothetical protein
MRPRFEPFFPARSLRVPRRSLSLLKRRALLTGVAGSLMVVLGLLLASLSGSQAAWAMAPAAAPNPLELSSLDGTNGFALNGIDADDSAGYSVSGIGDVNGDGIDDILIGARSADPDEVAGAGESYVVFGHEGDFTASMDLADLDGTNGFVLNGFAESDLSGNAVSGAGDVNGDGVDDLIIGVAGGGAGDASYVVFGRTDSFAASMDLNDLDGTDGFILNEVDAGDLAGSAVSGAGDVNGDGFDDLIIGAQSAERNGVDWVGESYVVFGHGGAFAANLDLADLNGTNGFTLNGIDANDRAGYSVSGAGDVNNDGFDDVLIGAPEDFNNADDTNPGESYVVFGHGGAFAASLDLADLDGTNGFTLNGIDNGDRVGDTVSGAGDVNGDGFDDLIIGAPQADPNNMETAGESYVVFGHGGAFTASLNLADLNGTNGFTINGIDAGDGSGGAVSGAGDVNGDGFGDLIIGAVGAAPNGAELAGASYVVFGHGGAFAASLNLADLDGNNGFTINGINADELSGFAVSGAGDVNGDGFDDVLIGAPAFNADPQEDGAAYVVFGADFTDVPTAVTLDTLQSQPASGFAAGGWLAALFATLGLVWIRLGRRQ